MAKNIVEEGDLDYIPNVIFLKAGLVGLTKEQMFLIQLNLELKVLNELKPRVLLDLLGRVMQVLRRCYKQPDLILILLPYEVSFLRDIAAL